MDQSVKIVVLYGGVSSERDVSLKSGEAIAAALRERYTVELLRLDAEALPESIEASDCIVFPALHGAFGEDGQVQALMEARGVEYCGSDAASSRTCMCKATTKQLAVDLGISVPESVTFAGAETPLADVIIEKLGTSLVVKPTDQGSSVGLYFTEHRSELGVALSQIHSGNWMAERRIRGRELTIGLLNGKAQGIVEIVSASGVYDFKAKYTPGSTEYLYPAKLDAAVTARIEKEAEALFTACGCRDFARIDFLLEGDEPYFLEINTLPGLTATSLLPKSASCRGLDFSALADALVRPALERFAAKGARG